MFLEILHNKQNRVNTNGNTEQGPELINSSRLVIDSDSNIRNYVKIATNTYNVLLYSMRSTLNHMYSNQDSVPRNMTNKVLWYNLSEVDYIMHIKLMYSKNILPLLISCDVRILCLMCFYA